MKAIKLYARTECTWKSENKETAEIEVDEFIRNEIDHNIQNVRYGFQSRNRKKKPLDVTVSYYSLETIKQIVNDKLSEKR